MSSRITAAQHRQIVRLIPEGSSVLDVGCGDGALLARLRDEKHADGRGIEISPRLVREAVVRGLSVVQGDATHDLAEFPEKSVDYAILSETLQAMSEPAEVLRQLVRIGRQAIVAFPNFGHWRVRLGLLTTGRMPVTRWLPQSWHDTPNIHLCTIADFLALAADLHLQVGGGTFLARGQEVTMWPNLRADHALFILSQ